MMDGEKTRTLTQTQPQPPASHLTPALAPAGANLKLHEFTAFLAKWYHSIGCGEDDIRDIASIVQV
jgi:hypothetical protein